MSIVSSVSKECHKILCKLCTELNSISKVLSFMLNFLMYIFIVASVSEKCNKPCEKNAFCKKANCECKPGFEGDPDKEGCM